MRVYVELGRLAFQQQFAYRSATLAGIFTNTIFGVMLASVFVGLYASQEDPDAAVRGWSGDQTLTLVWINQSLLMVVYMWGWWEVARSIQSGAIVTDMLKPLDFFTYWLSRDLGRAGAHVITRGIPTFFLGSLIFDILYPESTWRLLGFVCAVVLAVTVSFTLRFMVNLLAFWVLDYRGLNSVYVATVNLLSGFLLPLAFFPDAVRPIVEWLPFRAVIMIPNEIYLGQVSIANGLAYQLGWLAVMILASQWLLKRGVRKVVVQGG